MSADLENTLAEMGESYRDVVAFLKSAYGPLQVSAEAEPFSDSQRGIADSRAAAQKRLSSKSGFSIRGIAGAMLAAASVALLAGFYAVMSRNIASRDAAPAMRAVSKYTLAYGGRGAVEKLIETQNPDGSWASDFLTRQNAAALRSAAGAEVAYRKAMRYLRKNGLAALSDEEMRLRIASASTANVRL